MKAQHPLALSFCVNSRGKLGALNIGGMARAKARASGQTENYWLR